MAAEGAAMSRSITVSEAQDQLLETAFELYRIARRLRKEQEQQEPRSS